MLVVVSVVVVGVGIVMVVLIMVVSCLFLAGLVDGGPLSDTVVVALPYDVCVCGECEEAFDRFSAVAC
jgi:hypothetical protein